jgi:hypothetical protein
MGVNEPADSCSEEDGPDTCSVCNGTSRLPGRGKLLRCPGVDFVRDCMKTLAWQCAGGAGGGASSLEDADPDDLPKFRYPTTEAMSKYREKHTTCSSKSMFHPGCGPFKLPPSFAHERNYIISENKCASPLSPHWILSPYPKAGQGEQLIHLLSRAPSCQPAHSSFLTFSVFFLQDQEAAQPGDGPVSVLLGRCEGRSVAGKSGRGRGEAGDWCVRFSLLLARSRRPSSKCASARNGLFYSTEPFWQCSMRVFSSLF